MSRARQIAVKKCLNFGQGLELLRLLKEFNSNYGQELSNYGLLEGLSFLTTDFLKYFWGVVGQLENGWYNFEFFCMFVIILGYFGLFLAF